MVGKIRESIDGNFVCSERRICMGQPAEACPFCGSIMSNWMDIVVERENKRFQAELDKIKEKKNESNVC